MLSDSATAILAFPASLVIAVAFVYLKRRRHKKTRFITVLKVLFSKRVWLHPSTLMDFKYVVMGSFVFSIMIAYATIAAPVISNFVNDNLTATFGIHGFVYSSAAIYVFMVAALYLAYEFAYWLDHYLSHKIPFLWEFHKIHHSATLLTPFTNWRVHPMDTIVFVNITALIVGSAHGLIFYFAGEKISTVTIVSTNIIIAAYVALYGHLQHSHLWISFTGIAGKIFLSPAHHQIHHSKNPIHYDKNFGAGLALFDWMFGTLHMPQKYDEKIVVGTDDDAYTKRLIPSVLNPFYYSARSFWKLITKQ